MRKTEIYKLYKEPDIVEKLRVEGNCLFHLSSFKLFSYKVNIFPNIQPPLEQTRRQYMDQIRQDLQTLGHKIQFD